MYTVYAHSGYHFDHLLGSSSVGGVDNCTLDVVRQNLHILEHNDIVITTWRDPMSDNFGCSAYRVSKGYGDEVSVTRYSKKDD